MLKNVLSLLLSKFYSKQESSLVAQQGIPDYSSATTITSTNTTNVFYEATAPFDCFFTGLAEMSQTNNIEGAFGVEVSGKQLSYKNKIFGYSVYERAGGYARKGEKVKVVFDPWGNTSARTFEVRFYKLIGGGYQALKDASLQGGGLCLRSYSNSLWTRTTPLHAEERLILFRLSLPQQHRTAWNTSRLQMVLLLCPQIQPTLLFQWPHEITSRLLGTLQERGNATFSEYAFRSEKVKSTFLNLFLTKRSRTDTPSLFPLSLNVGGASC